MARGDDTRTARQISRGRQRTAGDRSARLARTLMTMKEPTLDKLHLDEELREAIDQARAVTSPIARRRAERTLAGDLRGHDLVELAERIENVEQTGTVAADARAFQAAEKWRSRLIEEGTAALAEFPGGGDDELPRLISAAQRERATGKPPGAARALFRHVMELLKS